VTVRPARILTGEMEESAATGGTPRDSSLPEELPKHVAERAVVVEELRTVYVALPKALSTSLLWLLADAAGIDDEVFTTSTVAEVTPRLTIHDMKAWGDGRRLGSRSPAEVDRILREPGWFRFTVLRHPARRAWSAWQSKVLLHEPQFLERFGDAAWFPGRPESAEAVVELFRGFVAALGAATVESDGLGPTLTDAIYNSHWAPQRTLLGAVADELDHIGRVEDIDPTLKLLTAHLEPFGVTPRTPDRMNVSTLPFHDALLDATSIETLNVLFAGDYEAFGYEPLDSVAPASAGSVADWSEIVADRLPAMHDIARRNERVYTLARTLSERERDLRELTHRLNARTDDDAERIAGLEAELAAARADAALARDAVSEMARRRAGHSAGGGAADGER
jgi:hypothetical protein